MRYSRPCSRSAASWLVITIAFAFAIGATGAPLWAAEPTSDNGAVDRESYAAIRDTHWSLQPLRPIAPPDVVDERWPQGAIDRFVTARLEAHSLRPSPPADRRTLLRRMSFDLIGLPPTPGEVDAFLADESPNAIERAIERLLASPHYGERWGRHWLDVARYADTKGYVFTQEPRYPYSYTYRDYVIRSLNEDLPFDRFVVEQLAADLVVSEDDPRPLAALGFLTLGRRFNNDGHDIIDDRIDVVTRGFLGLTVTCARCHDHKYDPIPTEDYYSLYGVFASSREPDEKPLIASPEASAAYDAFKQERDKRQSELNAFVDEHRKRIEDELRRRVTEYLVRAAAPRDETSSDDGAKVSLGPGELKPVVVRRWRRYLAEKIGANHKVFGAWHRFAALSSEEFTAQVAEVIEGLDAQPGGDESSALNARVRDAFTENAPTSMEDVARTYGLLLSETYTAWRELQANAAEVVAAGSGGSQAPSALPDADAEALRQLLFDDEAPTSVPYRRLRSCLEREHKNNFSKLEKAVETWKATSPGAPARAMALVDADQPTEPRIFVRGNAGRPGEQVPRQFLAALSGEKREPFVEGSGRLQLARAIVESTNPLTARVIVNRLWQHHFGYGLVRTPSDFGMRGERPTHPELLDHLAARLIDDGWSLKQLHRQMLLSATYQQSSRERAEAEAVDPENRLLWKMNRRRLDFEPLRDAMLAASSRLETTMAGRSFSLFKEPFAARRTIYGFIDRQELPGTLRVFDLASPDATTAVRPKTTVPQQALYLMNSPFVVEQARHLAARREIAEEPEARQRVAALYRIVLSRPPSERESAAALRFLNSTNDRATDSEEGSLAPLERLAQALLLTNEFAFVD